MLILQLTKNIKEIQLTRKCKDELRKLLIKKELKLRSVFLIKDIKEDGINGEMAVHVDLEFVTPPQHFRKTPNVHTRIQNHLSLGHVGDEPAAVVGQFQAVEPGWKTQNLTRPGLLRTGIDLGRAEEGTLVENGHSGGGVVDGSDVGVGDVDGEDELRIHHRRFELEGSELN